MTQTSEEIINGTLPDLIKQVKEAMYTDEFKRSPVYNRHKTDLQTLGALVSKFCKWDYNEIEIVIKAALEDANFDHVELVDTEELKDKMSSPLFIDSLTNLIIKP